jgi:hypothetical protein
MFSPQSHTIIDCIHPEGANRFNIKTQNARTNNAWVSKIWRTQTFFLHLIVYMSMLWTSCSCVWWLQQIFPNFSKLQFTKMHCTTFISKQYWPSGTLDCSKGTLHRRTCHVKLDTLSSAPLPHVPPGFPSMEQKRKVWSSTKLMSSSPSHTRAKGKTYLSACLPASWDIWIDEEACLPLSTEEPMQLKGEPASMHLPKKERKKNFSANCWWKCYYAIWRRNC